MEKFTEIILEIVLLFEICLLAILLNLEGRKSISWLVNLISTETSSHIISLVNTVFILSILESLWRWKIDLSLHLTIIITFLFWCIRKIGHILMDISEERLNITALKRQIDNQRAFVEEIMNKNVKKETNSPMEGDTIEYIRNRASTELKIKDALSGSISDIETGPFQKRENLCGEIKDPKSEENKNSDCGCTNGPETVISEPKRVSILKHEQSHIHSQAVKREVEHPGDMSHPRGEREIDHNIRHNKNSGIQLNIDSHADHDTETGVMAHTNTDNITDNITEKITEKIQDKITDEIQDKITDEIQDQITYNIQDQIQDKIQEKEKTGHSTPELCEQGHSAQSSGQSAIKAVGNTEKQTHDDRTNQTGNITAESDPKDQLFQNCPELSGKSQYFEKISIKMGTQYLKTSESTETVHKINHHPLRTPLSTNDDPLDRDWTDNWDDTSSSTIHTKSNLVSEEATSVENDNQMSNSSQNEESQSMVQNKKEGLKVDFQELNEDEKQEEWDENW